MKQKEIYLIDAISNLYFTIVRYKYFLLISVIIGAGVGVLKNLTTDDHFESYLVGNSIIDNSLVVDVINSIEDNKRKTNSEYMAMEMGISVNAINNIKRIKANIINDDKEKSFLEKRFKIIIQTYNITYLDTIKAGIINYLNMNKYLKKQVDIYAKQKNELIVKLNEEITKLQQLQEKRLTENSQGIVVYNKSIEDNLVDLYLKRQEAELVLSFANIFNIIEDTFDTEIPSTSLLKDVFVFVFLFIIFSSIFISIRELHKRILARKKE